MGYSFAGGTTDGPGFWGFHQNTHYASFLWNSLRNLLFRVTKDDIACQMPKPILVNGAKV